MAQFTDFPETENISPQDEVLLRQGGIDKRILLNLSDAIYWCGQNNKVFIGVHELNSIFNSYTDVSYGGGDLYQVKQGTPLPYTSTEGTPSTDTSLYKLEHELQVVSRGANITDTSVIYESDQVSAIPEYIYSNTQQLLYVVPVVAQGKFIDNLAGNLLTTTEPTTYTLALANQEQIIGWGDLQGLPVDNQDFVDYMAPIIEDTQTNKVFALAGMVL